MYRQALPSPRHVDAGRKEEDAAAKRSLLPRDGADAADDKLHGRRVPRSRFVVSSPVPPFAHRVAELLVLLGLAALAFEAVALPYAYLFPSDTSIDKALLDGNAMDAEGSAPDWMVRDDRGVPADEREHLSALHEACTTHSEAIIPFRVGRSLDDSQGDDHDEDEDQETRDAKTVLYRGDPRTLDELRHCPDVDIYLPGGLRGLGYCEDGSAYAKCECGWSGACHRPHHFLTLSIMSDGRNQFSSRDSYRCGCCKTASWTWTTRRTARCRTTSCAPTRRCCSSTTTGTPGPTRATGRRTSPST